MPLSVAIVCKNSDATIGRTLESVRGLADEIVALDSGSTDGTIGLLERYGARVIRTEWKGYVGTKQLALEACTQEWVLSLDADESPDAELASSIRRVIAAEQEHAPGTATLQRCDGFRMNRKVFYRGRPLRFAWQPELRLRLVRRDRARWAGFDPHDYLEPAEAAAVPRSPLPGFIRHDSIGTFADFLRKQAGHARTMATSLHARGRRGRLLNLVVSPPGAFVKQLVLKQAWRDGWPGWLAAASAAAGALMKHAMLIELSRGARVNDEESG